MGVKKALSGLILWGPLFSCQPFSRWTAPSFTPMLSDRISWRQTMITLHGTKGVNSAAVIHLSRRERPSSEQIGCHIRFPVSWPTYYPRHEKRLKKLELGRPWRDSRSDTPGEWGEAPRNLASQVVISKLFRKVTGFIARIHRLYKGRHKPENNGPKWCRLDGTFLWWSSLLCLFDIRVFINSASLEFLSPQSHPAISLCFLRKIPLIGVGVSQAKQ